MITVSRRELLRRLGVGSAVLPFLGNLPSLAATGSLEPTMPQAKVSRITALVAVTTAGGSTAKSVRTM